MYQQLQKAGLYMSHYWTIKIVEDLREDFDETVLKWKEVAEGNE